MVWILWIVAHPLPRMRGRVGPAAQGSKQGPENRACDGQETIHRILLRWRARHCTKSTFDLRAEAPPDEGGHTACG